MRVTDDVQRRRARRSRGRTAMLDQGPANTLAPRGRLDEERIQFRISILSRKDGSKACDGSICLGDEYSSGLNLLERQLDRIGIRQQRFSISGVVERSAPLKRFKCALLRSGGRSNVNMMHFRSRKSNT